MVRDALWLEREICEDFKCSFFSAKAYISLTWRDVISENTYKQTEMRRYFWFRSPDQASWASSLLRGEAQLVMPTGRRWKLWTSPIRTVGKTASQELRRYGRSRRTCATRMAVSVQPWSWAVFKPLWWCGEELSPVLPEKNKLRFFPTSPPVSPRATAASLAQAWRFTVWMLSGTWKWAWTTINWEPEGLFLSKSTLIHL